MDLDRIKLALARFVEQVTARVDYLALYPCEIVAQNEDGTVEVKPDDQDRLGPGLSHVPIRGLPGVTVKVKKGARALVGFDGGSAIKPFVSLWQADSLDEIAIKASTKVTVAAPSVVLAQSEGDARPVATVGSIVQATFVAPGPIPPGTPCVGVGYVTDGVASVLAGK